MKKINNWEKIQEFSDFKRLPSGGYICAIKSVKDVESKEYLEIEFDIVKGDEKGYFTKMFEKDTRKDKKWPNAGIIRRSYKDNSASMFKSFITAVEKSNKGYNWEWKEDTLKNKYFGAIIGEEEYLNQKGQKRIRNNVFQVRSVDVIEKGEFTVPELKKLDESKVVKTNESIPFDNPFANYSNETEIVSSYYDDEEDENPFDNL